MTTDRRRLVVNHLIQRYGRPDKMDSATALRVLSLRHLVHPRDVLAFCHRSEEAACMFAEADRRYYGHHVGGPEPMDNGFFWVIDFRPVLALHEIRPTDPSWPDGRL